MDVVLLSGTVSCDFLDDIVNKLLQMRYLASIYTFVSMSGSTNRLPCLLRTITRDLSASIDTRRKEVFPAEGLGAGFGFSF